MGCPLPTYIKEGEEEAGPRGVCQVWGVLLGLPSPSRIPLHFPIRSRREGKRGRGRRKGGPRPHPLSNSVWAGGRRAPPLGPSPLSPLKPNKAHYFSQRIPVTPRYSKKYPNRSKTFRCPNISFQYMNLYLSTISRLLVMSVISSGTPNNLWSSNHINS